MGCAIVFAQNGRKCGERGEKFRKKDVYLQQNNAN
jgi:hypothetical protein